MNRDDLIIDPNLRNRGSKRRWWAIDRLWFWSLLAPLLSSIAGICLAREFNRPGLAFVVVLLYWALSATVVDAILTARNRK